MAVVGELIVLLAANNAPLTAGLLKAEGQLKSFGATQASTGAMAGAIFGGIGLAAVAGMGLAVNAAKNFQEQMAIVNTIAHQDEGALTALGTQVRALSVASGVGTGDLTSGLYDLLSVGVPVTHAMEFLGNAVTLSIGGISTANEAVNAITTAINAWGGATGKANLTMEDSAKVTDIFAKSIGIGGFTAAEIPGALANVAASAAALNVPLEEIGAAWGILTTRGQSVSEAATSVDAALTALQKAPPGMEKLEKATGKTYLQIAKTQGVHAALQQIVDDAQKYNVELTQVFGRKEALPFVRFTTGSNELLWLETLGGFMDVDGEAAGQMRERMGTLDQQLRVFGASVNDLGITLGTALLPPLTMIFQSINSAVQSVTAWASANPALSSSLLPIVAAVGLLGVGVALLGAPFVAIGVAVGLVATHMDELGRGVQVVIDTIQRMIELARIGADTVAAIPGVKYASQVVGGASRAVAGDFGPTLDAQAFRQVFQQQMGRPANPLDYAAYQRGQSPIQLNSTTTVVLDGQKVGEITERRLLNNASTYSSGFSTDERPRH